MTHQQTTKTTRERTTMEGPGTTTKTTTFQSSASYGSEGDQVRYKSLIAPRNILINRSMAVPAGHHSMSSSSRRSASYGMGMSVPAGAYTNVTNTGVQAVRVSREREKRDMQDLNERFASYIEKVRFLEAQNRRLADELEKLKAKWGKETSAIKAMYQAELDEARRLLDDAEKEKARLEIRCASLEEQIEELRILVDELKQARIQDRETIERQNQQLSDYEAEINLLRRRIESLESDRERDKKEIARLTEALNRARIDLDNETLNHIDAENRRQTLEEELEFLKQVHEQEMKELAALAYRDTTSENREFWKNEMGSALREIQCTYDEKLDAMRGELETYYNLKLQEFRTGATRQNMETVHSKEESKKLRAMLTDLRAKLADLEARNAQLEKELELLRREHEEREREWESENTELKNEVARLRAEMEAILKELQDLMDTKLGLELEIAAYRKLLEGEENRIGLKQVVDTWISGSHVDSSEDSSLKVSQVVKGEMSAKTTYQRSAKGPVSIMECSADGKYVAIENTGRKEESLAGWRIQRIIDGSDKADFTIPKDFNIKPGQKIKIFAKGQRGHSAGANDIESSYSSWGIGANITTKLINPNNEDRATHIQKTIYTS